MQSETLQRRTRLSKDGKENIGCGNFLDEGCGQSYEVFSTLSAPPNLGARVTPRKFLNGQTGGSEGRIYLGEQASNVSYLKNIYILPEGFKFMFEEKIFSRKVSNVSSKQYIQQRGFQCIFEKIYLKEGLPMYLLRRKRYLSNLGSRAISWMRK